MGQSVALERIVAAGSYQIEFRSLAAHIRDIGLAWSACLSLSSSLAEPEHSADMMKEPDQPEEQYHHHCTSAVAAAAGDTGAAVVGDDADVDAGPVPVPVLSLPPEFAAI